MKSVCNKVVVLFLFLTISSYGQESVEITPPGLTTNPSLDITATNTRPLLSFFRSKGGVGARVYTIQLDTTDQFNSKDLIEYKDVPEENEFLASKQVEKPLKDKTRYYWRAKAIDIQGNESHWSQSRFNLNTEYNKNFMNLVRLPVQSIEVSTGQDPKNIDDLNDPGQITYWQAAPPGPVPNWVKFDLGMAKDLSRIWMLSNINTDNGWLVDFQWEMSTDGKNFQPIPGGSLSNNDTLRNRIDIKPIHARYLKLKIDKFRGVSPQINAIVFYGPGNPPLPKTPSGDYVLLIGDQKI